MAENGVPKSLAVLIGAVASGSPEAEKKESPRKVEKIVARAIEDSDDGWVNLAIVGSRILGAAPDFDSRTYGCANLSTPVTKSGGFEVRKESGKRVFIRRKATGRKSAARSSATA